MSHPCVRLNLWLLLCLVGCHVESQASPSFDASEEPSLAHDGGTFDATPQEGKGDAGADAAEMVRDAEVDAGPDSQVLPGDRDGDTIVDDLDNCPDAANTDQANGDLDTQGDVCDADDDGDGITDKLDNCPSSANLDQDDTDRDGQGDACDGSTSCTTPSTCATADELGTIVADDTNPAALTTSGAGSRFVKVRATDTNLFSNSTGSARIMLSSSGEASYALYLYGTETDACGSLDLSVTVPPGESRTLWPAWDVKGPGTPADRTLTMEVRHVSGACDDAWRLKVEGNACPSFTPPTTAECENKPIDDGDQQPGNDEPGVVSCGEATSCDLGTRTCCAFGLDDAECLDDAALTGGKCPERGGNAGAEIVCDGPEDCSDGLLCCFAIGFDHATSACAASCDLGGPLSNNTLCHQDGDCPASETCQFDATFGWGFCQ